MKKPLTVLAVSCTVGLSPTITTGQMVTSSASDEVCPDRPQEPEIIENMDVRDSHRTLLIQTMYYAYRSQLVVESGDCSCENRFPSWEPVVEYYLEHYAGIEDRWDVKAAQDPYSEAKESYRVEYREICVAQGNWR